MALCFVTGLEVAVHVLLDERYPNERLYLCDECLVGFQKSWTLKGEMPFYLSTQSIDIQDDTLIS